MCGEIRIYVACLASYNNGILHGAWIDACQDESDIWEEVKAMLAASSIQGAEEWAIHDYEGFEGIELSEYSSFESVAELAAFVEEHGNLGSQVYAHFHDLEDAKKAIESHYCGCFEKASDFAQQITEETTKIPESLVFYIDYEKMASNMEINDILVIETAFNEQHVFWRF